MDTRDPSPTTPLPLTRREALAALAAAGGYALSASPIAAEAIKTDSQGLVEGTVRVAGADQTPIPVYEAYPAKEGDFPVVVVISSRSEPPSLTWTLGWKLSRNPSTAG